MPLTRRSKFAAVGAACVVTALVWLLLGPVPAIDRRAHVGAVILDRNGVVLYEPLAPSGARSEWLDEVPARAAAAIVAAEDRRFFRHFGIDPVAVARALIHDVRRGALVEGGSTITQQAAKMLCRSRDRGIGTKVREAVVAVRIEVRYSKREILALYANLAPFGNRTHGLARASRLYFGVEPSELTVSQAAFLAALPQRPSAFNPRRDPERARGRQRYVLRRMRELGFISGTEWRLASEERLRFARSAVPPVAQHFVERVMEEAGQAGGEEAGRSIRTTLDAGLQESVQGIIAAHRHDLVAHGASSVAVAVLDNATGAWLAWEGSGDYYGEAFGGAIDGVRALRQPGSTLKPFTYALAFERGDTPATVLPDVPATFPTAEPGVVYSPRNYDGVYRGPLRAREALAGSENVPAVALLDRIGPPSYLRLLRNAGFSDLRRTAGYYGLGLTLGDAEVRLEQLVAAYSIFARGGRFVQPTWIPREAPPQPRALLSPRTAFWITDILSDADARAFIFGTGGSLDFPFPVAVKTGTSQSYRDNWTIGYTREVTVGVWVGNFDRRPLHGSSGVTGAAPVFHDVMLAAARQGGGPPAPLPAGLVRAEICALSGARPSLVCPVTRSEWLPDAAAVTFCSWHRAGGVVDWPDEYRMWAKASERRPAAPPVRASVRTTALRVTSPPDGATYLVDPTLRRIYQSLPLRASARSRVTWSIGERRLGTSPPGGTLSWPLEPGSHAITARDAEGNSASVRIRVR